MKVLLQSGIGLQRSSAECQQRTCRCSCSLKAFSGRSCETWFDLLHLICAPQCVSQEELLPAILVLKLKAFLHLECLLLTLQRADGASQRGYNRAFGTSVGAGETMSAVKSLTGNSNSSLKVR